VFRSEEGTAGPLGPLQSFEPGPLAALFHPLTAGEWELVRLPYEDIPCHGYWGPQRAVSGLLMLNRCGETWMSLMPVEVESLGLAADCAQGEVMLFGLGLGWLAALCALRPEVERVTVVECDRALIAFHCELGLFERLPDGAGDKVQVVEGDALEWRPERTVDFLQIDIWQPLVGEGRLDQVRTMQANVGAHRLHFWGQELEIARHAAFAGRPCDDAGIAATVAEFALPLAGPELPGYAERVRGAAAKWLAGLWFVDTPVGEVLEAAR
jgi:hypothetical protein